MEVKINVNDLKQLIEEKAIKDLYYDKLKEIKELMKANAFDKVQAVLDSLFLGV
jgi:hypothetical protein